VEVLVLNYALPFSNRQMAQTRVAGWGAPQPQRPQDLHRTSPQSGQGTYPQVASLQWRHVPLIAIGRAVAGASSRMLSPAPPQYLVWEKMAWTRPWSATTSSHRFIRDPDVQTT
jgi:hypothetical protein